MKEEAKGRPNSDSDGRLESGGVDVWIEFEAE